MGIRRLLPIILCLLSGCASYHARPLSPVDIARNFEQRSLADAGLRAYLVRTLGHDIAPWPPLHWDRELLTAAAWYDNPSLRLARAQWQTARAGIDVASARPNPTLQLPFDYATPNPGPGAPFTTGPALDIPIETAGKRGYRIDQATHLAEAARLNLHTEAWKVSAQVRDALIALYAADTRGASAARRASDESEIVAMLRQRLEVGQAARSDVEAATMSLQQAQRDDMSAQTALNDARAQLAAAIGVPISAIASVRIDTSRLAAAPPAHPLADAQREAVFHRSDLLASLADYAAAESALQLEVAKQYPDIHLGPGYTYDTGTRRIAFGLAGIALPIFDQNQGGIREAESKREEAAARTAALQDKIIGELDQALARYRTALAALHLADQQLSVGKKVLNEQAAGFSVGQTDRLALTTAKADYETTEMSRLDALVAAQQAAGAVEDAMQRPLDHEIVYAPPHRQDPRR
jgi:outer membrane protein, heavy metal efflux system